MGFSGGSLDTDLRIPFKLSASVMMSPPLHRILHLMMPRVDSSGCLRKVPSKEKLIPEHKVRFAMENSIVIPATASLSEEEIAELWVTDEELKAAQKRIKEEAKFQKKNRKDYIQAYIHVWDLCSKFLKDEPKAADSHARSQVRSKRLAEEKTRGYEGVCFPHIAKHRRMHAQDVLKVQSQLRQNVALKHDFKERILASRAMQTSRQSKLFARAFGDGDAIVCSTINI
jgi:hypothetical protein